MATYGMIKKEDLYNVGKKENLQKPKTKLPEISKEQLYTIPGVYRTNINTTGISKDALTHLPYVNKDTLLNVNNSVLQRAKQLEYERFLRTGYTTDAEWQKLLDNAKLQADYSNSKQLNSYVDVLASMAFGTKFENKGSVYKFLEKLGLTWDGPLNILGGVANLIDYTWQYNIKPITQGQWSILGKNIFVNFAETADLLANPVKGLIHEGASGVVKSLGLTGDGRQNYDYDTGSKAVDIVLEVISDPGVWATLGGWALAKGAVKAGGEISSELVEATIKSGVKELAENVGEEATKKWLKKSFHEAVRVVSSGKTADIADMTKILLRRSKKLAPGIAEKLSADSVENISKVLLKVTKQHTERVGVTILRTIDKLDTAALKASFAPVIGTNRLIKKIRKTVNSRTIRVLEPFIQEKEILSVLDYDTVMSKVSEVTDSLVDVVEQQGLKSFDNTEVQKAFYKYTKEDINNFNKIFKKYSKGVNVDYTTFKAELISYLTSKHNFDALLNDEIIPDIINKLALPATEDTVSALKTFLKNPLDAEATRYIRSLFPEDTTFKNIQALITDDVSIEKMLNKYAEAIDNISKQTALFENLKGSFATIQKTYANLKQAEDFIKTFKGSTITTNIVYKAIDSLKKININDYTDVEKIIKNLDADFDAHYVDSILKYIKNADPLTEFTETQINKLRSAVNSYLTNAGDIESEQFIKLFLHPEADLEKILDDIYYQTYNNFIKSNVIDAIVKPVYTSLGLSNITAFEALVKQTVALKATDNVLNLSEATNIFKQDIIKSLQEFYNTVSYVVNDALKSTRFTPASESMLHKAYGIVQKKLQNSVNVFKSHYKSILENNPSLKSNMRRFEEYGKELLSTNGTQKKITELVQNITKSIDLPEISKAAYRNAEELKDGITDILSQFQKTDADAIIAMSENGAEVALIDTLQNTFFDLANLLKSGSDGFDVLEFKDIVQRLDSMIKHQRESLIKDIELGAVRNVSYSKNAFKIENEVTISLYDKLETLVNNAYEVLTLPERTFSILGDATIYALKTEQTWNTLAYLSNNHIMDFVHKAMNKDGSLPQVFLDYTDSNYVALKVQNAASDSEAALHKALGEAAVNIQKGVDAILAYEQLLNVLENNIDDTLELRSALLSTINSPHVARMSVDDIAKNREALFSRIFEGVENYINAQRKTGRYTLDAFRDQQASTGLFEKLLDATSETWAEMAHHADADVITTAEYFKHELPDFKVRDNDIIFDVETSSLNEAQGEVLEVSIMIKDRLVTFKRHLNPGDSVQGLSNRLLDLYAHGETNLNIVKNNFYNYYNKGYTGPQAAKTVFYFDTEADLLQAVQSYIHKNGTVVLDDTHTKIIKEDARSSRLLGHNINGYDISFLKTRAEKTGVPSLQKTLDNFEHVDSYKLIQEKHNFIELNDVQKQQIKDWMSDYITARTRYSDTDLFSLYHSGEEFINAIPEELSVGLKQLTDGVSELERIAKLNDSFSSDTLTYFKTLRNELKQARINHIKSPNLEYSKHLFTEDQLNTAIFKDKLKAVLKQNPAYKNYTEEQLDNFVEYLNPSKALYSGHEFINRVGFKKIFDPKVVRGWFNYTNKAGLPATEVPEKLGRLMFNTAKKIERVASYVRNPKALTHLQGSLDSFLDAVRSSNVLQRPEIKNSALKYIILDTDAIADKYSLVLYLRQTLENNKMLTGQPLSSLIPENVLKEIDEVIANHKLFTSRTIRDTDLTFAEITKDIVSDEFWTSAGLYAAKAEDFANNIETFNFIDDFDKAGIFSPEKQIMMHGAQKTGKLLSDFADWVADATTLQLFDAQAKLHYITEDLNRQTLRNVLQYDTPDDLLQRLVWNHGAVFNVNESWDIYTKLTQDATALKEAGILMYKENDFVYLVPDRRVLDIRCELHTVNDVTTKHIYVGKKGMPLHEVPMYSLKELDVDTAIELCKKEFAMDLGTKGRVVSGALDEAHLTQLGVNLKEARAGINTITNGAFIGVNADLMQKKTLRHLFENAPEEVQKAFGDIDSILDNDAWFSGTSFNLFNLGSTASKRTLQPGTPTHFLTGYKTTTEIALKTQETRFKFIDMVLNNDMRLDVGIWANEANNANIIKYLKEHPELTVAVLHKSNNAKGYNIKRIAINTVEDLQNARKLHASLLTNQMYSRAASVVYSSVYDTGFLNAWSKISKLYKIGQLSIFNFGALCRNFIDSTIKMFISTKDVMSTLEANRKARKALKGYDEALYGLMATAQVDTEAIERIAKMYNMTPDEVLKDIGYEVAWYKQKTIKDVINASVLYEKYNTALDEIIKMDSNAVLRPQNVEFYFNYMAKDFDAESFYEVHKFITQGSSAGHTSALQKVFAKDAGADLSKNIFEQVKTSYDEQGLLDTVVHFMSKLGSTNAQLEQIIRLTQHMQQLRKGYNFAESNLIISKVHFDYADKTDITKSIELLFPYYNFKMKNFEYWADLVETQPWVMRLFADIMTPVWDFDSYDTYQEHLELANNESLSYQILSGNIPLNDNGLTLKLNPSITDAIQMVTNPFGNAQGSLWAPFNDLFKTSMLELWRANKTNDFINNTFGLNKWNYEHQRSPIQKLLYSYLPLTGPTLQRQLESKVKYNKRTNSPLVEMPSLFGATSRWNLENIKTPAEQEVRLNNLRNKYKLQQLRQKQYSTNKFKRSNYSKGKSYKPSNRYYKAYNPSYSKYISYYSKPYNRYSERSLIHSTRVSRPKRVYRDNIYWKYYTRSGKRRMDILAAKTTRKNLQMKIKLMYDYYR